MHRPGEDVSAATPLIGVSRCSKIDDYITSVERAGGRLRVVDVHESPRDLARVLQGVLLTGGGDVDPALYGEPRHESTADAEPGRDEFEIGLARHAVEAGLPLLGICRGAQVLNVSFGGSLVQDIPDQLPGAYPHAVPSPADAHAHQVTVAPGTVLATVLGRDGAHPVNSRHHQAIARVGKGLIASARADDGVVEAIERPGGQFCLAVQWHPENFWRRGTFDGLFAAFVAAARERLTAPL